MVIRPLLSFALRTFLLFGFWLLLLQPETVRNGGMPLLDWAVGAATAVCAALLSLKLLPPLARSPRPLPLLRFLLRFAVHSIIGALDVARRALDPRLPVQPALLRQPTQLRRGGMQALFGAVSSQVPGTLSIGSGDRGSFLFHCLYGVNKAGPSLTRDETLFSAIFGGRRATSAEQDP